MHTYEKIKMYLNFIYSNLLLDSNTQNHIKVYWNNVSNNQKYVTCFQQPDLCVLFIGNNNTGLLFVVLAFHESSQYI
jgi:hypothetical protein